MPWFLPKYDRYLHNIPVLNVWKTIYIYIVVRSVPEGFIIPIRYQIYGKCTYIFLDKLLGKNMSTNVLHLFRFDYIVVFRSRVALTQQYIYRSVLIILFIKFSSKAQTLIIGCDVFKNDKYRISYFIKKKNTN